MSFLWWPRWLISCPVIPIRIWDFLHSTVVPNSFLSRIIYVTPLPIWTLPACRDRATLRLEHSSKFYSWWQQWHKQRTLYPIESVTEYDDLTWNTSQYRTAKVLSIWNILVSSAEAPPGAQPLEHMLGLSSSAAQEAGPQALFIC